MNKLLLVLMLATTGIRSATGYDANPVAVKQIRVTVQICDGDKDSGANLITRIYNPRGGEVLKLPLNKRQEASHMPDDSITEVTADWTAKANLNDLRGFSVNLEQTGRGNPHVRLRYKIEFLCSDDAWYCLLAFDDLDREDYNFPPSNPDRIDIEHNPTKRIPSYQVTEKVKLK